MNPTTTMHGRAALAISSALGLVASPLLAEPAVLSFKRTGPWEINYDNQACHLQATFGSGGEETILRLTRFEQGDGFGLSLFGSPFASSVRDVDLSLDFGLGSGPVPVRGQAGTAGARPVVMTRGAFFLAPPKPATPHRKFDDEARRLDALPKPIAVSPEREAAVTRLVVDVPRKAKVTFETGSMALPMAAMRKCVDDLVKSWGYDPATIAGLTRKPMPLGSLGDWLSHKDYPKSELVKGRSALVSFRLDVATNGAVTRCTILQATGGEEFGKRSCEILSQRARLAPALDAEGKPVAAFFRSSIYWMMP